MLIDIVGKGPLLLLDQTLVLDLEVSHLIPPLGQLHRRLMSLLLGSLELGSQRTLVDSDLLLPLRHRQF